MDYSEIKKRLAGNIKSLRKTKGLNQFELAEKSNISEAMIKRIELGLSWPSEKTLSQICVALEIDIYQLFIPVSNSLSISENVKKRIENEINQSYKEYVNAIIDKLNLQ